jgi:CRP/FNR family transcriptional activator FtrB
MPITDRTQDAAPKATRFSKCHRSLDIDQATKRVFNLIVEQLRFFTPERTAVRQFDRTLIRALPLFLDMGNANFNRLVKAATLLHFPQQASLIIEGELPTFLYVVIEGSVELFCTHDGHETTIDIMQPVTPFILTSVIRGDVYLTSARTLTPAQILLIPAQMVHDLFNRDFAFARAVGCELAASYRSAVRSLKNEKLRTGAERLANWILRANALQGNQKIIELPFEKHALASSLGMTAEHLSRSLARLTQYGIKTSGRNIVIEDSFALERFAKPNALIDD